MPEPVGVVVPVRNGAAYLGAALDSVLAQDVAVDVVVVDDGSTDASAGVARARGVRVVPGPEQGIGPARNAGVQALTTEWLAFLDADDLWTSGSLRVRLAACGDGVDLCFGHAENFHAERGVLDVRPGVLAGALLLRRPTFDRVGPFAALRAGELADWVLRARELGLRERMLDDVVLRRRVHDANTTRDREALRDYAAVLKASLDRRRAAVEECEAEAADREAAAPAESGGAR